MIDFQEKLRSFFFIFDIWLVCGPRENSFF
jgi:hypothetical protein